MLSTGEEIRSPQRSSRSGPIFAKMPCTSTSTTRPGRIDFKKPFLKGNNLRSGE